MRIKLIVSICVFTVILAGMDYASAAIKQVSLFEKLASISDFKMKVESIKAPDIKDPQWLTDQVIASQKATQTQSYSTTQVKNLGKAYTYDVSTRGVITADLAEFKAQANETLNDARGWSRMGVSFTEVASAGDFTLVLSEASQVPTFNYNVCSSVWSCQVGRYVIINQDRWLGASDSWNGGGGSLRDYRNMVVNHETGHWLGHGHLYCSGSGQLAPVMQQQSISMQGCAVNPWPLDSELWASR